jgi:glycosyltransferase involved in cell wall biosynthesis
MRDFKSLNLKHQNTSFIEIRRSRLGSSAEPFLRVEKDCFLDNYLSVKCKNIMRLLVVGHSYVKAIAQRKYVEMKCQCEELELRILTPRSIPHFFMRFERELAPGLSPEEVIDIREFFGHSHMSYVLDPFRFTKALREFQPDRIHIEEDPYSAVGVEAVFLAGMVCPSAKISFFIWDNLARVPRFPLGFIKRVLNRYSLSKAELVVCGNKDGELLLREKKGYTGRTAVLPQLGLDPDDYVKKQSNSIRNELAIPPHLPLIGFVGRLIPEKGVTLLLEALNQLKDIGWRVIFLGSGPLESEINGKWQGLLEERLVYRKAVPHAEVPAYMCAMDIFVLPSYTTKAWKEQFGLVLAQAMMAGVPCIGSSSGAIPDVIGPGGLIFKEKNVNDLARTLERLLIDLGLRKSLAENAQKFALQNYTHAAVANAYLQEFGDTSI